MDDTVRIAQQLRQQARPEPEPADDHGAHLIAKRLDEALDRIMQRFDAFDRRLAILEASLASPRPMRKPPDYYGQLFNPPKTASEIALKAQQGGQALGVDMKAILNRGHVFVKHGFRDGEFYTEAVENAEETKR